jgi:murein DD-endopeptidase MepM/ murein hydrolase activator NlpD
MKQPARIIIVFLISALFTASCTSSSAYWIPPSSFAAAPTAVASLPESSPLPPATVAPPENTPTQAAPDLMNLPTATPLTTVQGPPDAQATQFVPPVPASPTVTPEISVVNTAPILYYAQAADTLAVVSVRFGVLPSEIISSEPIRESGYLNPGQLLIIPRRLANTTGSQKLISDSEVVYSPSALGFDAQAFAVEAGGYLGEYDEWHKSVGTKSGGEVLMRVALENSINPRLLAALLEYHTGWIYGQPVGQDALEYPMGLVKLSEKGLYNQLVWAVNQLSIGYYAYREGRLTEIRFSDGVTARLAPDLNAGTAALQYYFAQLYGSEEWFKALDPATGFPALHARMFGDPWARSQTVEPLFPPGIQQPPLTLPFGRNWTWALTGGPHGAWEHDGAYAALDFAPGSSQSGCVDSNAWVVASADGLVVRTGPGLVVLDLDGDGHEQTGWVLVYLHVATEDRIPLGSWVAAGDKLGHPSCEGGLSTGTHLHFARKFNGEWVPADGPLPFNLGGWIAHYSGEAYKGTLTRDGQTITACTCSNYATFITRTDEDP